jgi:farnesoic acid O-methyltransferase
MTAVRLVVAVLVATTAGCKGDAPGAPYRDDFERAELGPAWRSTAAAGVYAIQAGALRASGAHNHPLWLAQPIPQEAVIELDCWSASAAGDIKVEAWGDGRSFEAGAPGAAYVSSGYVFIFGGWGNTRSEIARGNEHGADVVAKSQPRVEVNRRYHFKIVRRGGRLDWFIDDLGQPFLSYDDPHPLLGSDHAHFGFDDWESELHFDNLSIAPLTEITSTPTGSR